ncbi:MAG: chorismate mutase [Clostridiales bacterium]|nr:chorismate mutase [Clostridiales bacterium]
MDIKDLRVRMDEIDSRLLEAFEQRMRLSKEFAEYKKLNSIPIFDLGREREKLTAVADSVDPEFRDYSVLLYHQLFEFSKSYQTSLILPPSPLAQQIGQALENTPREFPEYAHVACQGTEGANSQIAADRLFTHASVMYLNSFEAVFSAVKQGLCRYAVIPVENSTAGTVNRVYDLMTEHDFYIVRSLRLKVDHNLLAKPGVKLSEIKEIYSHEQALSQSSKFLSKLHGVKLIPCENTAVAARRVQMSSDPSVACVSSAECVRLYGLNNLAESIQNNDNNYTRFICISKELEIYPGANRTSVMLTLPHEPGALYKLLSRLYSLNINLIKLESRPLPKRDFEYMFYFDLETSVYSERLRQLMSELPNTLQSFKYLGSYSELL